MKGWSVLIKASRSAITAASFPSYKIRIGMGSPTFRIKALLKTFTA